MLKVNGISVRYDIIPVLKDVSFSVTEGQFVAIVGANSAGKTTILKAISGLINPFEGSIEFIKQPIQALAPYAIAAKGIAHVPEGRRIFDKLTVRENMLVGAHTRDDAEEVDETLQEMFEPLPHSQGTPREKRRNPQRGRTSATGHCTGADGQTAVADAR